MGRVIIKEGSVATVFDTPGMAAHYVEALMGLLPPSTGDRIEVWHGDDRLAMYESLDGGRCIKEWGAEATTDFPRMRKDLANSLYALNND